MLKKILLLIFVFNLPFLLLAQENQEPYPCGTKSSRSPWLKKFQANPDAFPKSNDILYIPLKIHITGASGRSFYSLEKLQLSMCALNDQFAASDMYFYILEDINYIDNAAYHRHDSVREGAQMMFEHNVPNALNCYIVSDPAGNCGYNLPYAGVALAVSCINSEEKSTWAHEIGHALSLPHPFLGWEGGQTHDGNVPPNFGQPAPDFVTYDYTDFQDTYFEMDTLIIDTALVERMDGSNCANAADGFCDTKPDYLARRWNCNGNNESSQDQRDPNNVSFKSDGTLYMSYADDACAARFSDEQIQAMRANLMDEKPELITSNFEIETFPTVSTLFDPAPDAVITPNDAFFQWEEVEGTTTYLLQVSRLSNFSGSGNDAITRTVLVEGNSYVINDLDDDKTYYWRVRPFNNSYFCTDYSEAVKFFTSEATAIKELQNISDINVIPNLLNIGNDTKIYLEGSQQAELQIQILDLSGKEIETFKATTKIGTTTINLPTSDLTKGLYWIVIQEQTSKVVRKVVIQ